MLLLPLVQQFKVFESDNEQRRSDLRTQTESRIPDPESPNIRLQ